MLRVHFLFCATLTLGACSKSTLTTAIADTELEWTAPLVLDLEPDQLPVIRIRVNGGEGQRFLVDTGASLSLFERDAAVGLGLDVRRYAGTSSTVDSSGITSVIDCYVALREFRSGGLTLRNVHITISDAELLRQEGYAGVVGQDLLSRLVVLFDMDRRKLHLLGESLDQPSISAYLGEEALGEGTWAIAPVKFDPCPLIPLRVHQGESEPEWLEIDTGATTCSVPSSLITSLGLEPTGASTFHGVNGSYEANLYHLDSFDLFGLSLTFDVHEGVLDFGLLGMNVLSELVFILDGPGSQLWLHRRDEDR